MFVLILLGILFGNNIKAEIKPQCYPVHKQAEIKTWLGVKSTIDEPYNNVQMYELPEKKSLFIKQDEESKWICLENIPSISNLSKNINWDIPEIDLELNDEICNENFLINTNEVVKQRIDKQIENLSKENVNKILLIFSKPDGFRSNKLHLGALISILQSDFSDIDLKILKNAMQGINYTSPALYHFLMKSYPTLSQTIGLNMVSDISKCRSEREQKELIIAAENQLKVSLFTFFEYDSKNIKFLEPLTPLLKFIEPSLKQYYKNFLEFEILRRIKMEDVVKEVFESKLLKLISRKLKEIFGEEYDDYTDIYLIRDNGGFTPVVLSNKPIDNDLTEIAPGFYFKLFEIIPVQKERIERNVEWATFGRKFLAKISIVESIKSDFMRTPKGPNYSSMLKDGVLTGLIAIGSTINEKNEKKGTDEARDLTNAYVQYYLKGGDKDGDGNMVSKDDNDGLFFHPNSEIIENAKKFILDKIASGEIDYFLKEAHSDGDEKNLFSLDKKIKVIIGERRRDSSGGRPSEKVYILSPVRDQSNSVSFNYFDKKHYISNDDFAEAIIKRENRRKGEEFVFFNNSCNSEKKAIREIETVKSPLLIDIANLGTSFDFSGPTNSIRIMLDRFRVMKNFQEMRDAMERLDVLYKEKKGNYFIFPDEGIYKERIYNKMKIPADVKLEIFDSNGQQLVN